MRKRMDKAYKHGFELGALDKSPAGRVWQYPTKEERDAFVMGYSDGLDALKRERGRELRHA